MNAAPRLSASPSSRPPTSAPGIDPSPPMTMISKPFTVVTAPLVGKTMNSGASRAPARPARAAQRGASEGEEDCFEPIDVDGGVLHGVAVLRSGQQSQGVPRLLDDDPEGG